MAKFKFPTAKPFLPPEALKHKNSLAELTTASKNCKGCDLYKAGTQTVFGEGPKDAEYFFVGEQPGDKEDLEGHPFVGPAGALLDRALIAAGIDRQKVYVTNAVKHFKWRASGKKRIHMKPGSAEIAACHPWLEAEIKTVKPKIIICLGATATLAVAGKEMKVMRDRGKLFDSEYGAKLMATVHPSSILRVPDQKERHKAFDDFVKDLKKVHTYFINKT
jgi:uracil-DNA glycosylase